VALTNGFHFCIDFFAGGWLRRSSSWNDYNVECLRCWV